MNSLMKHYKEMKDVRFFLYNIQDLTKQKKKKQNPNNASENCCLRFPQYQKHHSSKTSMPESSHLCASYGSLLLPQNNCVPIW